MSQEDKTLAAIQILTQAKEETAELLKDTPMLSIRVENTMGLSAAKNSKISPNSWYMIHNVSGFAWGDVNEVERQAKNLRNFNNTIRDFYSNLTGKSKETIEEWMNNETWFTGAQAVENGFVSKTTDQKEEFKPINQADWSFKNKNALNVFNSIAATPPVPVEDPKNFNQNLDMKNLATLIGNAINTALANFNIVPKEGEGAENNFTPETITNAVSTALEGYEPPAPTDEQVQNAISNFFTNGLPENILTQISDSVKPVDFKESEDWKNTVDRIGDIEGKISNGFKPAKTPENDESKKYEGISFE
ncbi:ATP-dependent Clp protease proteolytic subunit [Chryseobacterium sp. SG20098]|uniref:ATP-dependent Clp protease proteolytic subunit n=1 Tax=Chryseobacterium sp. SG20098 TaxID=3074145 RepID=UPI002882DC5F|nr:ATP-dependent Clp protease proteolytic subunit [Chryseobacterium sp. SG20098]WNI34688.1 ATP-dependent Clp protease proteolytic subunit [Chryseobacterium sp. SG20098]